MSKDDILSWEYIIFTNVSFLSKYIFSVNRPQTASIR